MKLAVAVLLLHNVLGVVPPPATQDITTLLPQGGRVADPPVRPQRPQGGVGQAKLGRLLGVDQIDPPRRLYGFPLRYEAVTVIARYDLGGAVETLLESIPYFPERRHFPPARPEGAGSRQPVALALCPHMVLDCLKVDPRNLSLEPDLETYHSSGIVIVQLDQRLHVASFLVPSVQEVPGLPETEVDVIPTTAPLPVPLGHAQIVVQHLRLPLLCSVLDFLQVSRVLVTGTLDEVTHGACPCDRVGHTGRCDGVHKTSLSSICNTN